jgi:polyphosphate kinase 2 (PPK2 family)
MDLIVELDHDYLRRYACCLPARGDIGIVNRSHYEEVPVVRVHPGNLDRQKLPTEAKGKDDEKELQDALHGSQTAAQ